MFIEIPFFNNKGHKKSNKNNSFSWKGEEDVLALAETIYPRLSDYVDWYCEKGLYLPKEFATDPATWTNILREIQEAFRLLHSGEYRLDEDMQNRVDEGLVLFGKYFRHLWK
jgi:hypothetical protein